MAALGGGTEALEGFVRGWRQHFLDVMAPRHMPPHWRVDARVANSSVKPPPTKTTKATATGGATGGASGGADDAVQSGLADDGAGRGGA